MPPTWGSDMSGRRRRRRRLFPSPHKPFLSWTGLDRLCSGKPTLR